MDETPDIGKLYVMIRDGLLPKMATLHAIRTAAHELRPGELPEIYERFVYESLHGLGAAALVQFSPALFERPDIRAIVCNFVDDIHEGAMRVSFIEMKRSQQAPPGAAMAAE